MTGEQSTTSIRSVFAKTNHQWEVWMFSKNDRSLCIAVQWFFDGSMIYTFYWGPVCLEKVPGVDGLWQVPLYACASSQILSEQEISVHPFWYFWFFFGTDKHDKWQLPFYGKLCRGSDSHFILFGTFWYFCADKHEKLSPASASENGSFLCMDVQVHRLCQISFHPIKALVDLTVQLFDLLKLFSSFAAKCA